MRNVKKKKKKKKVKVNDQHEFQNQSPFATDGFENKGSDFTIFPLAHMPFNCISGDFWARSRAPNKKC